MKRALCNHIFRESCAPTDSHTVGIIQHSIFPNREYRYIQGIVTLTLAKWINMDGKHNCSIGWHSDPSRKRGNHEQLLILSLPFSIWILKPFLAPTNWLG
jgi:hypothetical protein